MSRWPNQRGRGSPIEEAGGLEGVQLAGDYKYLVTLELSLDYCTVSVNTICSSWSQQMEDAAVTYQIKEVHTLLFMTDIEHNVV